MTLKTVFLLILAAATSVQLAAAGPRNGPKGSSGAAPSLESETAGGDNSVYGMWESLAEEEDKAAVADDGMDAPASVMLETGADGYSHLAKNQDEERHLREEEQKLDQAVLGERLGADPDSVGQDSAEGSIFASHNPMTFLPVLVIVVVIPLVGAAIYFKRSAEALKSKALSGSESEGDDSNSDETMSFDNDNPRVMVNRQLLDRMTSISNKLKASVQQARSETTSSVSSNSQRGPGNGSRKSPGAGSGGQGSQGAQASGQQPLIN